MTKMIIERINQEHREEFLDEDNKPVTIRLNLSFIRELDALAKLSGMTRSSLVNEILESGIKTVVKGMSGDSLSLYFSHILSLWNSDDPIKPLDQYEADLAFWEANKYDSKGHYIPKPREINYGDAVSQMRTDFIADRFLPLFSETEEEAIERLKGVEK